MCHYIAETMEAATRSWVTIALYMEQLLTSDNTDHVLIEDDDFSQSKKLFWIISKIDQILPMIADTIAQWNWFSETNNLSQANDGARVRDGGLRDQKTLKPILEQIRRLNDCPRNLKPFEIG